MIRKRAIALLSNEVRETLENDRGREKQLPFVNENRGAVLFVDVSGFTKLGKKFRKELGDNAAAADKLAAEITRALSTLTSICYIWGGDVVKFAGDALICTWNVTKTRTIEECLRYARRTAYEMKFNVEKGEENIKLHGGIGSGSLMYIHIGNDNNCWHLASGMAMHQAAEQLRLSGKDEILYSLDPAASVPEANDLEQKIRLFNRDSANGRITKQTNVKDEAFFAQSFPDDVRDVGSWEKTLKLSDVKRYLPKQVQNCLEANRDTTGEIFSKIATMFVSLDSLVVNRDELRNNAIEKKKLRKLSQAFITMTKIVQQYHGEIRDLLFDDKGCVFIAVFGAYTSEEMSELRCVRAADNITMALPKSRIGVSVGPSYAGVCGSDNRSDFIVMGHDVNQAARLMAGAETGQILVETAIMTATDDYMAYEPARFQLKQETYHCFSLKEELLRSGTFIANMRNRDTMKSSNHTFVPRDHEMDKIMHLLRRKEKDVAALLVTAKEGMGKSCLIRQVRKEAAEDCDIYFAAGFVLEEQTTFFVIRQLLHELLGVDKSKAELNKHNRRGSIERTVSNKTDNGRKSRVERKVRNRNLRHLERKKVRANPIETALIKKDIHHNGHVTKYLLPEIISTLNKNNNRTVLLRKNDIYRMQEMGNSTRAHTIKEEEISAAIEFLDEVFRKREKGNQKSIIVVEDIQWVDQPSLEILNRLLALNWPYVTFMFTSRPITEEADIDKDKAECFENLFHNFQSNRGKFVSVDLHHLDKKQSEQLTLNVLMEPNFLNRKNDKEKRKELQRLNANDFVDQEVLDSVYSRTEGHPSHLSLLVNWLVEKKYIEKNDLTDKFCFCLRNPEKAKKKALTHVPEEIERIVRYHTNELPGRLARILKVAAVLGKSFSPSQLQVLLRLDESELFSNNNNLHVDLQILQLNGFLHHVDQKKLSMMSVSSKVKSGIQYRMARYLSSDSQGSLNLNWKFQDDITQEVILKSIPRERLKHMRKLKEDAIRIDALSQRSTSGSQVFFDDSFM